MIPKFRMGRKPNVAAMLKIYGYSVKKDASGAWFSVLQNSFGIGYGLLFGIVLTCVFRLDFKPVEHDSFGGTR